MHVTAIKTWAREVGESEVSRSNPDPAERDDRDDEHRHSLDGENAEFQRYRGRHRIEQAGTEDVGGVRQRVGEARRLYWRRRGTRGEEHGRGEEEDEEREGRHDLEGLGRLQDDGQGDRERAKEHRPEEQRPRDEERAFPGRGEARAQHGKREAKHQQGARDPDDERREDDAQDVLSAGEGPHQELLEHSVLPVEPELRPRVRAPVDDGQRHRARRKEKGIANHSPVPDIERWDDSIQPESLDEDEEQRKDQLEEQGSAVEVRSDVPVDQTQIDVQADRPPFATAFSSSVTRLMNASSSVVSEM